MRWDRHQHKEEAMPNVQQPLMQVGQYYATLVPFGSHDLEDEIWRLEEVMHRGFVRRLVNLERGRLKEFELFLAPSGFRCREKPLAEIVNLIVPGWLKRSFRVEQGSQHRDLHENEPVIRHDTRYAGAVALSPEDIPIFRQIITEDPFGAVLAQEFFLQLKSWRGFYDGKTETFQRCIQRPLYREDWDDNDVHLGDQEVHPGEYKDVEGTVPDLDRYHDTSDPLEIKPYLAAFAEDAMLECIAADALCPAVRSAAAAIIREHSLQLDLPFIS